MFSAIKLIQDIQLIHLFCYVADEEMDVVLGYIEAGVAEEFWKGDYVTAIDDPLLGEGVPVAMNAGCLHEPLFYSRPCVYCTHRA